jgi:hypothetical protein
VRGAAFHHKKNAALRFGRMMSYLKAFSSIHSSENGIQGHGPKAGTDSIKSFSTIK